MTQPFQNVLPNGTIIENYEIQSVLGAGSFGITYRAFDQSLKRPVAIKEFFPELYARRNKNGTVVPKDEESKKYFDWAITRFSNEAQLLAKFKHNNIVGVINLISNVNNTSYIVMDFLEGISLGKAIEKFNLPKPDDLTRIFMQIMAGCEFIHGINILHRDIKPDNIMLVNCLGTDNTGSQYIKYDEAVPILIDFGSSRDASIQSTYGLSAFVTDGYSPPEQYSRKNPQGKQSDIYALGATLYFMITGQGPAPAAARYSEPELEIPTGRANIFSRSFYQMLERALDTNMNNRPADIDSWRSAVKEFQQISFTPQEEVNRYRRTFMLSGAFLSTFIVSGAGYLLLNRNDDSLLSDEVAELKATWSLQIARVENDPYPAIAATPGAAVVAAHRLLDDGNYYLTAVRVNDKGQIINEWVDKSPGGRGHAILPISDGFTYIGGTIVDQAILVKLGPDFKESWRQLVGSGAIRTILPTKGGVIVGIEDKESTGARLRSVSDQGALIWETKIDSASDEAVEDIVPLSDGGYAVAGSGLRSRVTSSGSVNESYAWVTLLDNNGTVRNRIQTKGLGTATCWSIVETDSALFATGRTAKGGSRDEPRLLIWAISKMGVTLWEKYDYPGVPSSGRKLIAHDGDKLYLAGWSGSPPNVRLSQVGPKGQLIWDRLLDASQGKAAISLSNIVDGAAYALVYQRDPDGREFLNVQKLLV